MKKLFAILFLIASFPISVYAVYVNGYYRSNGTYVNGYERTAPDGNPYNNYSYPGNYNPNTGSITGGSADAYLNNYYKNSSGGSSYSSSYSVPSTPSCPSMATYDSLSSSCKCMSGYVVDSTGSSCTSGTSYCWNKMGYGSSYDSISKTCSCSSGYKLDNSGQCVSNESYCSSTYGYGAEYSYLKSQCVCKSSYVVDTITNKCIYNTSATSYTPANSYTPPVTTSCPMNSYASNGNCYCSEGYQINSTKDACISKTPTSFDQQCKNVFGADSSWDAQKSTCNMKITVTNPPSSTTANGNADESCKLTYGQGSYWGSKNCYCSSGYQWNTPVNKCIESKMKITKNLKEGTTGVETVMLKNFLATQNLYFGIVSTPYDRETTSAVSSFQSQNGIPSTGTVGNLTRNKINSLMYKN